MPYYYISNIIHLCSFILDLGFRSPLSFVELHKKHKGKGEKENY